MHSSLTVKNAFRVDFVLLLLFFFFARSLARSFVAAVSHHLSPAVIKKTTFYIFVAFPAFLERLFFFFFTR
jgi:hypothetical protein